MQEELLPALPTGETEKSEIIITVESDFLLFSEQENDVCFVLSMKETIRAGIMVDWDYRKLIDTIEVVILRAASYLEGVQRPLPPHFKRKNIEILNSLLFKDE